MFLLPQPLAKVSRLSLPADVSLPGILPLGKADIPTLVSGYFSMTLCCIKPVLYIDCIYVEKHISIFPVQCYWNYWS